MKKYITYTALLTLGLLLGWFLFGSDSNTKDDHNHNAVEKINQKWTCSMHPQIMQPEAGDCPICGMELIPAEVGADGLAPNAFKLTENAMALANIQTSKIGGNTSSDNTFKLSGKIEENEEANTVQASYFSGRIERLNVNSTGEKVRKGQLLATIYSPELYTAQQELLTAVALKNSQPALYKAVRNKLKLWKLSDNQINKIESSGKVLENFPVYATVSGTVSDKLINQGDYVKQGQPLLKIANLNTVWANFDVYENQINTFKKGQNITVTTNANPNKKYKAKVSFINPILNTQTRTVNLRVVLANSNNELKPGMFVQGEIEGVKVKKENSVSVPASAVLWTGKRSVIYLKTNPKEPVFEMREISLGTRIGDNYQVLDGLSSGDEIVTNGTFTVDASAQLQGKKSMMNQSKEVEETHNHNGHNNSMSKAVSDVKRLSVSKEFQKQLSLVFNEYIALKEALVNDDSKQASIKSKGFLNQIEQIDMTSLTHKEAHMTWMTLEKELKTSATSILKTKDLKAQRVTFKNLSSQLLKAIQVFGINKKVYNQFCPMADNDKGAFWLSQEEKVINPYFGSVMLGCGETVQIIE